MAMEEKLNEKRSCSIADWKRKLAYMCDIEESKRWIWGWTVEREKESGVAPLVFLQLFAAMELLF